MSDAPAQGLVERPVRLYLIPLTAREQPATAAVLVVVLSLQLHLGKGQSTNTTEEIVIIFKGQQEAQGGRDVRLTRQVGTED